MKDLLPFLRLLWPQRNWVLWTIVATTLTLLASIGLLAVSGWFLSASAVAGMSLAAAQHFTIFTPSASLRGFAVLRTAGRYLERVIAHEATLRLLSSLRVWFYRRIEPQAPASLYRHRSGDLLNRIITDIDSLDLLFIRVLSPSVAAVCVAVAAGSFLWWLAPPLAVTFLCFFLGAGLLLPLATHRLGRKTGARIQQQLAHVRTHLLEDLQGAADLAIYGAAQRHSQQRLAESDQLLRLQEKMARITGFSTAMMTLGSGLAAAAALYVAIPMAQSGHFAGALLALIAFGVLAAFEAVLPLPLAYQMLGKIRSAAQRLLEVSETQATVTFPRESARMPTTYSVCYRQVSFTYPDSAGSSAVDGISLLVPAQTTMALVGRSGCGKTTMAHLLTRFWDPVEGDILIGDIDLRQFAEGQLRQMITLVSQQSHIFNATLRHNLLIADPHADDAALWTALERAQLADFVAGLPEGLATWAGEGGSRLSGGEARRLVLARALLRNSPVWILDEPTEGLDNLTRRHFTATLFANLPGKTVLLISHTHEILEQVDQVCFMDKAQIVASGRHDDLMNHCPQYRQFVSVQRGA